MRDRYTTAAPANGDGFLGEDIIMEQEGSSNSLPQRPRRAERLVEVYHDEGDVNLFNVIRLLRDMDWEGSLLADHSPSYPSDPGSSMGFAFANGYIQGLLREAREEAERFA